MQSTLNLKRNADGIVDGIVASDIGKFPDTNLAESLQRISGVSIDRSNGEGQKVTVRGLGPDFNLVLLNGRQMPTTDLSDLSGRSFDFSNLASEAISQLQVYKTGRADSPTGGIGGDHQRDDRASVRQSRHALEHRHQGRGRHVQQAPAGFAAGFQRDA